MKNLKIILFFVVIGLILAIAVKAEGVPAYPAYTANQFQITPDLLTKAGYTGVAAKTVAQSGTYFPNYYFTAKEAVAGDDGKAWGSAANLITIFVRTMPQDWVYNNGAVKTENIFGKYQVSASKPGYYFVVTGPDQTKANALLQNIENLY